MAGELCGSVNQNFVVSCFVIARKEKHAPASILTAATSPRSPIIKVVGTKDTQLRYPRSPCLAYIGKLSQHSSLAHVDGGFAQSPTYAKVFSRYTRLDDSNRGKTSSSRLTRESQNSYSVLPITLHMAAFDP